MAKENRGLGNHALSKGQKTGGVSKSKAKSKPKKPKNKEVKLYVYQEKKSNYIAVTTGPFLGEEMVKVYKLVGYVTVEGHSGTIWDLVGMTVSGLEFHNSAERFKELNSPAKKNPIVQVICRGDLG